MVRYIFTKFSTLAILTLLFSLPGLSQKYLTGLDSSLFIRDTVRPIIKRFENINFSGYIQSQFQVIGEKGAKTYGGGDFSEQSNVRFMLRRARVKLDYLVISNEKLPKALFTFQIDATERSVRVRDMFIRVYEAKKNNFSLTTGIFARPFGFEVNLSSSYRETPERGRMSQILVPSERDIGVMVTYEPQKRTAKNKYFSANLGVFNGPGLSGTLEFDNVKDIIGHINLKPYHAGKFEFSGGISALYGGWRQQSKYVYKMERSKFSVDSAISNVGKTAPRHYYGTDVQVSYSHAWGATEIRGEVWAGKQSGTEMTTANPGTLPTAPTYVRNFNGAFFYFLQDIANPKNQLIIKYDWYDPNTKIKGNTIGQSGNNLTSADIKYSTLGFGFIRWITNTVKVLAYYEIVKNETTQIAGYTSDLKDNLFTLRLQFRF